MVRMQGCHPLREGMDWNKEENETLYNQYMINESMNKLYNSMYIYVLVVIYLYKLIS